MILIFLNDVLNVKRIHSKIMARKGFNQLEKAFIEFDKLEKRLKKGRNEWRKKNDTKRKRAAYRKDIVLSHL